MLDLTRIALYSQEWPCGISRDEKQRVSKIFGGLVSTLLQETS